MQGRFIICHLLPHCMLIILKSILCGPYQKDIPPIGYVYVKLKWNTIIFA